MTKRYHLLDALRGCALLSMITYHLCYNLRYLYGLPLAFLQERSGFVWQQATCWVFLLTAGAAVHLSRRPARRGLVALGCGMLLTAITLVAMPSQRILFGVLHFLGIAILLTTWGKAYLDRIPPIFGTVGAALLFWGFRWFSNGLLFGVPIFDPTAVTTDLFFVFGVYSPSFFSSDYFALLPWYFLFLAGTFGFALLREKGWDAALGIQCKGLGWLSWLGRHSLAIYLLHQPVLLLLCMIFVR